MTSGLLALPALVASLALGVAQAGADEGAVPPPTAIQGGWEVTGHQVLSDGGATTYHYERDAAGAIGMVDAEIQWHRSSAAEIGTQLEARGLLAAGTLPTVVTDQRKLQENDWANVFTNGTAQVYAAPESGSGFFQAAGVWEEDGFTYVASAGLPSREILHMYGHDTLPRLYMLERLLERVERLDGAGEASVSLARKRRARHARRHARHHHRAHHKRSGRAAH